MKTIIQLVYPEMSKLLTSLIPKFVKSKLLREDSNNAKSVIEFPTLNVKDAKIVNPWN